jgi:calcium-dependent protein kinase
LNVNPAKRYTIPQILEHSWFINHQSKERHIPLKIFESLKNFRAPKKLQQEAMKVIIRHLTTQEIEELKVIYSQDAFISIDTHATGYISAQEIEEAIKQTGYTMAVDEFRNVIESINYLGTGKINYTEFLICTIDKKKVLDEDTLSMGFKLFDLNHQGYITTDNLYEALERAGLDLSHEEAEKMIEEASLGSKDKLDFESFKSVILNSK